MEAAWEKTTGLKFEPRSRTIYQPNGGTYVSARGLSHGYFMLPLLHWINGLNFQPVATTNVPAWPRVGSADHAGQECCALENVKSFGTKLMKNMWMTTAENAGKRMPGAWHRWRLAKLPASSTRTWCGTSGVWRLHGRKHVGSNLSWHQELSISPTVGLMGQSPLTHALTHPLCCSS